MSVPWILAFALLATCVVVTAFVVVGTLRRISGVLEQAEARLREAPFRPGPGGLEPGSPLPVFRARGVKGGWLTEEDLRGSPALLVFISSTCPACSGLIRDLRRKGSELSVPFYVVVSSDEEVDALGLQELENVVVQDGHEVSIAFRTSTTPHAFSIDRNGLIVAVNTPNTLSQLQELVDPASTLGGDAVRQERSEAVPI